MLLNIRIVISASLLLIGLNSTGQTEPEDAAHQYLLNASGGYSNNSSFSSFNVATRVGGIAMKRLALGVEFGYSSLNSIDNNIKAYQIDVGPFARYYVSYEQIGLFVGAEASYFSYVEEYSSLSSFGKYASLEGYQYGPNLGMNFFFHENISFEVLFAYLWQTEIHSDSGDNAIPDKSFIIEFGFTVFL